jgi:hypothetical protein
MHENVLYEYYSTIQVCFLDLLAQVDSALRWVVAAAGP